MYEAYQQDDEDLNELKNKMAEWFLENYSDLKARDMYRWLWEGEFGAAHHGRNLSLDRLTEDIRLARIKNRRGLMVWEPLGLANVLVKVNLVPYSDSGCPLKRLIMLEERARDVRPNPLRFKHDWNLLKTQLTPDMPVKIEHIHEFENSIPFHLTPEVQYTDEFIDKYGLGYRVVPRTLFFDYFPEYSFESKELF